MHQKIERALRKPAVHALLILVCGFFAYSNTFHAPFIWDDIRLIRKNPFIKDIHFPVESLNTFSSMEYAGLLKQRSSSADAFDLNYKEEAFNNEELYKTIKQRYVGCLTFALNYKLDGFNVEGYHFFNLVVHLLNGLLLYHLVLLTFNTPFLGGSALAEKKIQIALVSALFFVCHPVQTNAVTYIYQRFASLATTFTLLSLVSYVKWRSSVPQRAAAVEAGKPEPDGLRRSAWYAGALLSLVLGMKTKENVFMVPFAIALYEFIFFTGPLRRRMINLAPFGMTLLIIPLTYLVSMGRGFEQVVREYDFMNYNRIHYLLTQFRVLITYIRILFWPAGLTLDYEYPLYTSFRQVPVFFSFFAHIGILAFSVFLYRKSHDEDRELRLVSFGIWWFYLFHAMESSILTFSQLILEYRIYLPSIGFFIALSTGIYSVHRKFLHTLKPAALPAALGILILSLSVTTYARNAVWSDEAGFWEDNVKKSPGRFVPYYNLGLIYGKQGRLDDAIRAYQAVIRIRPLLPDAYIGLANIYRRQGRFPEALSALNIALTLDPGLLPAHHTLGIVYDDMGRSGEAVKEFNAVLRGDPSNVQARIDLGIAYFRMQNASAALRELSLAVSSEPENTDARKTLGMVYSELGRFDEAIREFEAGLSIDPGREDIRKELLVAKRLRDRN